MKMKEENIKLFQRINILEADTKEREQMITATKQKTAQEKVGLQSIHTHNKFLIKLQHTIFMSNIFK